MDAKRKQGTRTVALLWAGTVSGGLLTATLLAWLR